MCQPNDLGRVETGTRYSDRKPRLRDDLPAGKKRLCMDEAISRTKFGLFNYIIIFVGGMSMSHVMFETCSIAFVMPVSQCDLNLSTSEKGVLASLPYAGIICSSHLWGFLADTQGRRQVIRPTIFISFLMTVCSSFAQNFYFFAVFRFLNGFFLSGSLATIYAYLSEFHNSSQRSRAIMGFSVLYGLLCILLSLVAWSVINGDWHFDIPLIGITYKPWRLFLIVCSLPGLISFLFFLFLPESPKFVLSQGKHAEAYQILRKMNRINNGKNSQFDLFEIIEEPESIENRQRILNSKNSRFPLLTSVWNQTVPLFKPPYLFSTVLICLIQVPIFATGTGFYLFFAVVLNKMAITLNDSVNQRMMMCDIINMKPTHNETFVDGISEICTTKLELETLEQGLILEILYAAGFVLIVLLINKVGKFPILLFVMVGTGSCGIACMLTDIPDLQIGFFIILMTCSMSANIVNAATVEIYPTSSRAMAVSISMMFGRIGSATGANFIAFMLDNHCSVAFYMSGISLIVAGLATYFIPNIHNKAAKSEKVECGPRPSVLSTSSFR